MEILEERDREREQRKEEEIRRIDEGKNGEEKVLQETEEVAQQPEGEKATQSGSRGRMWGVLPNPGLFINRLLGLVDPVDVPDVGEENADGQGGSSGSSGSRARVPRLPITEPSSIRTIPSYVLLMSIGVCAVVLRVVLKRALRGVAGRA